MRAMLWKELRENVKWAALALLGLLLAEFYTLSTGRDSVGYQGLTLCSPNFLLVTSFGSCLVAAFLGAMQILPEAKRDRWAALLHRPVSRSVIFFGKVAAGVLLYFLATGLPFLASACYVAAPGVFPVPFVPGMLWAGASDLVFGATFYFGALLLCLQRGRWWGVRGVILLAFIFLFLLHLEYAGASTLILPLVAVLLLLLAAWGAMLANGPVAGRPWVGRVAYIAVMLLGAQTVVWGVLAGLTLLPIGERPAGGAYSQLVVTQDGQVLRQMSEMNNGAVVTKDLAGKVVTDERYVGNGSYRNFCQFEPLGFILKYRNGGGFFIGDSTRESGAYVQPLRLSNMEKEVWYILIKQNYLIGYDNLSHRCIGICDQDGFKPPGAKPRPFPGPLRGSIFFSRTNPALLWLGAQLYGFNFADRQMKVLYEAPGDIIYQAMHLPPLLVEGQPQRLVVALEHEIRLFDENGRLLFALPYLHDPEAWSRLSVATNKAVDRLYFLAAAGYYRSGPQPAPTVEYLDVLDMQGHSLATYTGPSNVYDAPKTRWEEALAVCALPLAPTALVDAFLLAFPPNLFSPAYPAYQEATTTRASTWETLLGLGLAWGGFAFFWARRAGFGVGRALRWAAFVFAFGPAGLLAFRLASDWPARVRCPVCGHKRDLRGERCRACGQAWPAPLGTGTEIFEDAALVQLP